MPSRNITRRETILGVATPSNAPIYIDSDDDIVKLIPAGSGSVEVELVDSSHTQTITGDKTFTGTVVMSGAVTKTEFADGTVLLPSITFSADLVTGIYRIGANNIGVTCNAAKVLDIGVSGLEVTGSIKASNAAGPAMADEVPTTTNPTLIPDKAEMDTGIGWVSDTLHVVLGGANAYAIAAASLSPGVTAAAALGTTALMWANLFLKDTGVINFNNGNVVITHAAGQLTLTGNLLASNAAGPAFVDEAPTTTNPTLCPNKVELDTGLGWVTDVLHVVLGGANCYAMAAASLSPGVTGAATLGTGALMWSDLFLKSASVINWNNGAMTLTHTTGLLTLAAGAFAFGASGTPITIDTPGATFVGGYFDSGAVSGWGNGVYFSLLATGAGASYTSLEGDMTVSAVATDLTGVECFMGFASGTGAVAGHAAAIQGTIDFANAAYPVLSGSLAAGRFTIKSEGNAADLTGVTRLACIELINEGVPHATASFDNKGMFILFKQYAAGAADLVHAVTTNTATAATVMGSAIGVRVGVCVSNVDGPVVYYYLPLIPVASWT